MHVLCYSMSSAAVIINIATLLVAELDMLFDTCLYLEAALCARCSAPLCILNFALLLCVGTAI
jgi:hypothetical protein